MLNDLERKQLETNLGLLGNALAEQAYMKIIMQGLKKLFMQAGRADITDRNQEHHPYEFEMTTCDSLMKLYDMNYENASALIDDYEKVLKEDDAERAKHRTRDLTDKEADIYDQWLCSEAEETGLNLLEE